MLVTFYADSALTQVIGAVPVSASIDGCVNGSYRVNTTWAGLSVGEHRFWVKVDSGNAVAETDETDNVGTGLVRVYPTALYLPAVIKW